MHPADQKTLGRDERIPAAVTTPDRVETRIGTLDFTDGMPSPDTLDKVYDHLDFTPVSYTHLTLPTKRIV